MNKADQDIFYQALGKVVTDARRDKMMSLADLAKKSGEQYKTVKEIDKGGRCYLHHIIWLSQVLDITIEDIVKKAAAHVIEQNQAPEAQVPQFTSVSDFM